MPENNMELAIYYCIGRELKDAVIVAYLLEYYTRNPTNCVGWLCTVSKAIPLLFKYNYDDFARKLFIRCFADQGEVHSNEYLERYNNDTNFRAFAPEVKLKSDESDKPQWYDNSIWHNFKHYINEFKKSRDFEKSSIALQVVPFPYFTANKISDSTHSIFFKVFLFLFIPRWYRIDHDMIELSPFSRMILCENFDNYDNPVIEAIIDFHWQKAKNYFFFTFFRFLVFAACFWLVSWAYLDQSTIINGYFLLVLIIIFYYLAIYQILTGIFQLIHRGPKKYFFDLLTIFDISSIILSVLVMTKIFKNFQFFDGFGSVKETDPSLAVNISFSIFLLWIELILHLRLMPVIGIYVYHVIIIFKTIFPFIFFVLIVIFAFAHTMFVLLRNPIDIKTKDSTYSGVATNSLTNEILDIKLKSDFDPMSSDNPYTSFSRAIMATYFWISSDWVQKDDFDYWAVDVYTLIASIFLVIVLQNMLIAYMSNEYEDVTAKSKQILLRHQANFISNYEALQHIHFSKPVPESKHIYYFSRVNDFEKWYNTKSNNDKGPIYKSFEIKSRFMISDIFKERDYDKYSLLTYDDSNVETIIEKYVELGKGVNNDLEDLFKRFIGKNSKEVIGDIENTKIDLKTKVKQLHDILEKLKLEKKSL
ncbi:unnamed protein product [Rhizophagus irregularis]|nr:unnamed protein product [Rhizophagus irregularis]